MLFRSNGTIGANASVGSGVVAKDFICGADTTIDEGASIERCFVGEGCIIDKGFSAVDTLIFANCEFANGEAASVLLLKFISKAPRYFCLVVFYALVLLSYFADGRLFGVKIKGGSDTA